MASQSFLVPDWGFTSVTQVISASLLASFIAVLVLRRLFREAYVSPVKYSVDIPPQCASGWSGQTLDEPSLKVPGSSSIRCYSPASGQHIGFVDAASPGHIDRAISKASEAQKLWKLTSFEQRRLVLRTLLNFVLRNQKAIATAACLDSGKTMVDASFGEILVTTEKLKWTIAHGEKSLRPEPRPSNFLMAYKRNEVRWEPLGVVAACVSWNYPFHNLTGPIISAIFAGNAIVVKGSEATAWSSQYFIQIVRGALEACGHDPNLVQSITCWSSVAPHLTSHPGISHLTFIGSKEVAFKVSISASKYLTPLCMELGGKDAAIILDDVRDFSKVASILMRGVFQSSGQNCIGIERIIACPLAYKTLITLLEPRVKALRVGNSLEDDQQHPVDVGSLISGAAISRLETLIEAAVKGGATLLAGGKRYHHPRYPKGHYFQPTLIVDVKRSMWIAQEELFAPVMTIMPARDINDAIEIANGTEYGLGGSVFGSNADDIEKVISASKTGMVSVNDFGSTYATQLPFGGVKSSGYGRFAGQEGLRSLCNTKSVCRDRFPKFFNTAIPPPLDYPIPNVSKAWDFCCGIVELGYGLSLTERLRGLWRLIRS